jgi:hypothetical protein
MLGSLGISDRALPPLGVMSLLVPMGGKWSNFNFLCHLRTTVSWHLACYAHVVVLWNVVVGRSRESWTVRISRFLAKRTAVTESGASCFIREAEITIKKVKNHQLSNPISERIVYYFVYASR